MKNKKENINKENVNNKNKSGISLIVLVLTILVIIVLAGAVILTVASNNPIDKANQAVFQSDIKSFESDLSVKLSSMMIENPSIDINTINADYQTPDNLLETYIPSIKGKSKYTKMVIVERGKLVLKKTELSPDEEKWADDMGVSIKGKLAVSKIKDLVLEAGMDNIKVSVLVDESENTVESYKYEIGKDINTLVVKDTNALKNYTFNSLEKDTKYFIKVTIKDKNNTTAIEPMVKEITTGGIIVAPGEVKIDIGNGAYTNQNVTATITYPVTAGLKCRYSYDGTIWEDYTAPLIVTKNTTIYAKMIYLNNEEITGGPGPVISTVSNIDKLAPNTPTVNLNGYTVDSWSKANVIINLTATDKVATSDYAMSDILGYEYSTNGGTNYTAIPANPWVISNDTIGMNILFKSIDKATNKSDATISYTIKKDSTLPTISSVTGSDIKDTSMSITVTANDSTSGIKGYKLSKDNGATWTAEQTSNVFNLTGLTKSTAYNIKAIVIDNATNEQTSVVNTISTIAPLPYDKPYTPKGFTHTDGTWNTGYVIKDNSNGNEFVWIPVKNIADFKRTDFGKQYGSYADYSETVPSNITASVTNYGGYYIGRYEQGTGNVSKQGVNVYNYINWNDSVNQAKAMYNSNSEIATDLIYGTMCDTACTWLETSGNKTHAELLDSTSWGNYSNNTATGHGALQTTGYSNTWKANNIYDLAGNICEWTHESSSSSRVIRGDYYINNGSSTPVVYRISFLPTRTSVYIRLQGSAFIKSKKLPEFTTKL